MENFSGYLPQVIMEQEHPHKQYPSDNASISWETKMLQWGMTPSDGEISAIIEFPLEDSILTERQFNRCLRALVQIVDSVAPRLKQVRKQVGRSNLKWGKTVTSVFRLLDYQKF